ncbi:MAG: FAD-dependent oxidoreductase [Lachnospiraceae bacterium]|nr:FAD-dependent oxidoreductase [Lachnospiraceae bacterium]
MFRINQVKLPYEHTNDELLLAAARSIGGKPSDITELHIVRESVDARKKPQIMKVYTLDIALKQEKTFASMIRKGKLLRVKEDAYRLPKPGNTPLASRPVIVGSGPAGLFCALMLAREGYCPILLERGEPAPERQKKLNAFWNGGKLDPGGNAQFGEGGAGTFSDGKLNTLVKDPSGRNREVLRIFAGAGAPEEICYVNKPHIGTDILIQVVQNIRKEILSYGGEVHFCSQVTDLHIENGKIRQVQVDGPDGRIVLPAELLVLAIGHSARDTFEMLEQKGIPMEPKAFAVGVRIEHPQEMIQKAQYGEDCPYTMPAASYKLTHTAACGRGVYSFCMCPGGYVVNASSEEGRLAVNGMSYHARDSHNANSAMIVSVTPADFPDPGPLGGIRFQRRLEETAYALGGGRIPQQLFEDFCSGTVSHGYGAFESCVKGQAAFADLNRLFPEEILEALKEGIHAGGKKIRGFDRPDAILSGVESRTSSPVRIVRDSSCQSSVEGIYPCGEGAGYAGGITSAAMDGMRVAEQIIGRFRPWDQKLKKI